MKIEQTRTALVAIPESKDEDEQLNDLQNAIRAESDALTAYATCDLGHVDGITLGIGEAALVIQPQTQSRESASTPWLAAGVGILAGILLGKI